MYVLFFQEMVGSFKADFYTINGLTLESRKRREHLSDEDLQKNKAMMENLSKGNIVENSEVSRLSIYGILGKKHGSE